MNNVLNTGVAGFISTNYVQYLLAERADLSIVRLDLLTYAGHVENLTSFRNNSRFKFIQGDILDSDLLDHLIVDNAIDTVVTSLRKLQWIAPSLDPSSSWK